MNEFYPKGEKIELPAVIQYPDIKYDVFCSVLEYIYTDQVSDQNCENVVHLLSAAEMFRLERLRALCEDIVRKSISISNVVSILLMAKQNNAESLKQICMDFCTANVEILKMNGSLKDLMQEPEIMYIFISHVKTQKLAVNFDCFAGFRRELFARSFFKHYFQKKLTTGISCFC